MSRRVLLIIMLAAAARSQVVPSATGGFSTSQTQMMTPPPVSGTGYPTEVGGEERTNYVRGGLTSTAGYINNLYAGSGATSVAETTVSILPTISYDATTVRQRASFAYSPGFTFYRPSSTLNEVDNAARAGYNFRLTEHATLSASDSFQDSSSTFNPEDSAVSGTVSGQPQSSVPGVLPPFSKRLTNFANAQLTLQTGLNEMIGGSGLSTELRYPNPAQTPGLYNSSSRGGSAFYNRRIAGSQYIGVTYQYMDMLANPTSGTFATQTHTISGYYSFYPIARLSLSVSGGPQYYQTVEAPLPAMGSWGPSVVTSMGWQGVRTNLAASYSQAVTGGGGLLGAFHSRSASASARWQLARTWTVSAAGAYSINKTVNALLIPGQQGGHSLSGNAAIDHSLGNQFSVAFNYDCIHEDYAGIVAIATNPNSDRESISIVWHFERPLGR
jgi:hypothetical protein